jgi:hypothetical protein
MHEPDELNEQIVYSRIRETEMKTARSVAYCRIPQGADISMILQDQGILWMHKSSKILVALHILG